ncbi:hypothetical protein U9M48_008748 [Paspalum notatum var. saurae]|uniref:Uncharacterized protein n=1 Tax=Paspalum notatum var. saurae TaxID=547442 RepID=A0AAQ3WDX9_PASNO
MRVPMAAPLPCPMAPLHPPPSFLSLSTKMDCPHHGKSVLLLCSSFRAPAPSTSSLCCKSRPWLFALRINVCEQQQEYLCGRQASLIAAPKRPLRHRHLLLRLSCWKHPSPQPADLVTDAIIIGYSGCLDGEWDYNLLTEFEIDFIISPANDCFARYSQRKGKDQGRFQAIGLSENQPRKVCRLW